MWRMSLRTALLAAFLTAGGAPLLVFWAWPHSAAIEGEKREARERHLLLAQTLAASLDQYHRDLNTLFDGLAPLAAGDAEVSLAEKRLTELHFRHICVFDAKTGALRRAVMDTGPDCPADARADLFENVRAIMENGETGLSRVVRLQGGRPGLLMARRFGDALVVAAITTEKFVSLASSVRFGGRGHAVIVDDGGRVLAHPNAGYMAEMRDLSALPIVAAMGDGGSGVGEFHSPLLDAQMIAGYAVAAESGWGVMVPQPVAELHDKVAQISASARLVFALGLALSAGIALLFSRRLASEIGSVSDAAQRMALGERAARAPENGGFREVATLARSFNRMARRVEEAHARVSLAARSDALTGLLNRDGFFEAAHGVLAESGGAGHAMFFIDVDRFKAVNDSYGHAAGDALLREVAARLTLALGPDAMIARQGGDEFLVLHPKHREGDCLRVGARILRALRAPVRVGEREIALSVSVGVSAFPRDAGDVEGLVLRADQAMYQAKRGGRNIVSAFDGALQLRLDEEATLARELRAAVAAGDLRAEFQPIIRARSGGLAGFEALARWTSPSAGPIPAERFITLAEETGLIVDLGRQVREHACAFAARLRASGVELPVSVNVSQAELAEAGFAESLSRSLAVHGLPPRALVLEITESVFQEPGPQALEALFDLRRRGVAFALDDFGKGYSAHRLLRTYPVDRLKIAADFVGDVTMDPGARAVVRSMIDLGRRLNLSVTVEGVETAAQRDLVASLGADEIQGFWHHPPLEAPAALSLAVRENRLAQRRAG